MSPYSRGACRPSCTSCVSLFEDRGCREDRVPACTRGPSRKKVAQRREDHRWARNHSGLPCAVVYGLLRALPGEPAFCHRRLADHHVRKTWRLHGRARTTRLRRPRGCRSSVSTLASTAFRSTFVTTRTPLVSVRNGREDNSDFPKQQARQPATDWHDGQFASGWHEGGTQSARRYAGSGARANPNGASTFALGATANKVAYPGSVAALSR